VAKFISLFSGCGGFDYGFSQHFQCAGAYDIEPVAIDSYQRNFSSDAFIHDLSEFDLPNQSSLTDIDILLSGSPCQGFSTIGKRRIDDPRNKLIYAAPEIAKKLKPKIVICENVPGVKAGQHSIFWDELKQRLLDQKYKVEEFVYDFSNHGLAQTRRRLFLIAYKGKKIDREALELSVSNQVTLKDVITNVDNIEDHAYRVRLAERDADPVSIGTLEEHYKKPYKKNLKSLINKGYVVEKAEGLYDLKGSFNGKYRRLSYDKPSYTVDTNFGNPKYFLHPKEDRGFSVREAARIQGFPDKFVFEGSVSQRFRMIGNAVPPNISEKLAKIIKDVFY